MKITALTNGPFVVEGAQSLIDENGREFIHEIATKFLLCRCGGSSKRPFCDGTHERIGFRCPSRPTPELPQNVTALSDWESEGGSGPGQSLDASA